MLGRHGMVACTQPLAAEAGLRILKAGGNAMDAAIATAAAMAVCEPCSTGLGGDAFALVYDAHTKKVEGLNASGRAPAALSLERAVAAAAPGAAALPSLHAHCVTVPGAAAGWVDALERWGSGNFTLADVLAPAISLASEGFPVSPITAHNWAGGVKVLTHHGAASSSSELLIDGSRAPRAGEVFRNPGMARVLSLLASKGKAGFYSGEVADAIAAAVTAAGGALAHSDLESHANTFPEPISVDYKGVRVWEIPPNGQGITALLALNTLSCLSASSGGATGEGGCTGIGAMRDAAQAAGEGAAAAAAPEPWLSVTTPRLPAGSEPFSALGGHNSPAYLHAHIEAMRLAFADSRWYVADPDVTHVPVAQLLSPAYAASRAAGVQPYAAAADVERGTPVAGTDTISFQVVDGQGNAVSFINSNFMGFGSGIVPEGCGFSLQNRGAGFSLTPGHPNVLRPGARPYHTIIPGLATWAADGSLFASFSNMGGYMVRPRGRCLCSKRRRCSTAGSGLGVYPSHGVPSLIQPPPRHALVPLLRPCSSRRATRNSSATWLTSAWTRRQQSTRPATASATEPPTARSRWRRACRQRPSKPSARVGTGSQRAPPCGVGTAACLAARRLFTGTGTLACSGEAPTGVATAAPWGGNRCTTVTCVHAYVKRSPAIAD